MKSEEDVGKIMMVIDGPGKRRKGKPKWTA